MAVSLRLRKKTRIAARREYEFRHEITVVTWRNVDPPSQHEALISKCQGVLSTHNLID